MLTIIIIYSAISLLIYPRVISYCTWYGQRKFYPRQKKPDDMDWFFYGVLGGLVVSAIWPLSLAIFCLSKLGIISWIFSPPKLIKREFELERLKEMEKELLDE